MSEEAPTTPVVEPSTPTTPAPETPVAPASEPAAQTPATAPAESASYFTKEQLAEMETMFANNGGFDKAWARMKDAISRPQQPAQPVTQPEALQAPSVQQMVQQSIQNPEAPQNASQSVPMGGISIQEMVIASQFERLANDPAYASISDEIKSGKVLEGLKKFNIDIIRRDNGNFNNDGIRDYLDLYAATKPAKPTSSEPANSMAMADDLSNIKEVTTMDEANRIELENIRRRAAGQPDHPMYAKAREFVKSFYQNQAKKGR